MPDFGFDGVSSSLAEFMSISIFDSIKKIYIPGIYIYEVYIVRNPDTTDNRQHTSSAGCVLQPAGYNAIHACRLPAEQEATPHACGSLSALYYSGFLVAFVVEPCDLCACGSLLLGSLFFLLV